MSWHLWGYREASPLSNPERIGDRGLLGRLGAEGSVECGRRPALEAGRWGFRTWGESLSTYELSLMKAVTSGEQGPVRRGDEAQGRLST